MAGSCTRLRTLRADGFEAAVGPLLEMPSVEAFTLLQSLTLNPSKDAPFSDHDALAAQVPPLDVSHHLTGWPACFPRF